LAIHTWPEAHYAAVDLFTCGEDTRPWQAFEVLKAGLGAQNSSAMEIHRGAMALLPASPNASTPPNKQSAPQNPPAYQRDSWFTQRNESLALSLKHKGQRLFHTQSAYQKIELYDSITYGKMLVLDGQIVLTEQDEYIYHEMITHLACQMHPSARKVLVIGGGDGGSMRELARYPHWEVVHMIEIDEAVSSLCQQHFPDWWTWRDRAECSWEVADAFARISSMAAESYDLIIVDLPQNMDSLGEANGKQFYIDLRRVLRSGGLMVVPGQAPRYQKEAFREAVQNLREIMGTSHIRPYLTALPSYPGGSWAFLLSVKGDWPAGKSEFIPEGLRYYNEAVHQAAFALPNDLQDLLLS
ncbi:MAG: bifunctional adenosylmethionine decarboxylase/class I SAM-dependent methyltransferase, partial [Bacteroidota bacterium]